MKTIYEYAVYKEYLAELWGKQGTRTGKRRAAALYIDCHTAYVSQVLNGSSNFSLEQAYKLNEFIGHDKEASQFFLLMVQKERAGLPSLAEHFQQQMDEIINKRLIIKNRLVNAKVIPKEAQNKYYSSWIYTTIHMLISVPGFDKAEILAERLQLSLVMVNEALEFLVSVGLVKQSGVSFTMGQAQIHLGNDSENILRHHTNWRLQGLKSLDRNSKEDLHYSVVYSIAKADALKIRDQIIQLVKANLKVVEPSPEETIYCNVIDFFEI